MKCKILGICIMVMLFAVCRRVVEWSLADRIISVCSESVISQTPGIVRLAEGAWMIVYSAQPDTTGAEGTIMMTRSDELQGPWSQPVPITRTAGICKDPKIKQLKSGLIIVQFNIGYSASDGIWQPAGAAAIVSYDYGVRFSVPKVIRVPGETRWRASGTLVEISENQWMMPVIAGSEIPKPGLIVSEDAGETWSEVNYVAALNSCTDWSLLWLENNCLAAVHGPAADGLCLQTRSGDLGAVWERAVPVNIYGTRPELIQSAEGTVYIFYQDQTPPGISMMHSYDFGKSYEYESVIPLEDYTAAPAFCIEETNKLVMVYTVRDGISLTVRSLDVTGVPDGLAVSADSGSVMLRWNQMPNTAYYRVYRSEVSDSSGGSMTFIGSTAASFFIDGELKSGLQYAYQVSAVRGAGRLFSGSGSEGARSRTVSRKIP